MKMILEFQEESSKRVKKFERKPCELWRKRHTYVWCSNIFEYHTQHYVSPSNIQEYQVFNALEHRYSRQCVECGLNCCRTHRKYLWLNSDVRRGVVKTVRNARRMLISTNKQWQSKTFDFNVEDLQILGLRVGIPQSLLNWAIKSYLPSTVRDAMVNLIPIEFVDYMSKCNSSVNELSGEINLAGAPLDVLNSCSSWVRQYVYLIWQM